MRALRTIMVVHLVLAGSLGLLVYEAKSDLEVSADVRVNAVADFYAPLEPAGTWVEVGAYGRCWRPREVVAEWRPYCEGEWVWTDCGWYWETDEPWGWACYHYGTWIDDASLGWCWVPGIEWAPAWVVWREGGGHIGWAPCAPAGVVVAPAAFAFVEVGHFNDPIRRSSVVINNTSIIRQTAAVGGDRRETRNIAGQSRPVMVNNGPDIANVEKATGRKFTPSPVENVVRRTRTPENFKPGPRENVPARTEQPAAPTPSRTQPATPPANNPRPAVTPRDIPANPPSEAPVKPPGETPVNPRRDIPAAPPREVPANPPREVPANPTRETPVNPSRNVPANPSRDIPATPPRESVPREDKTPPPREERPATPPRDEHAPETPRDDGQRKDQRGFLDFGRNILLPA